MKIILLCSQVILTILVTTLPAAAQPGNAAAAAADPSDERRIEAAYHFAVGKMLAEQADYEAAHRAYQRALELDASDPYLRLELAQLHADLADGAQDRAERFEHLREAAAQVGQAFQLAPDNGDVLRLYGRVHLNLAEVQAAAIGEARRAFEKLHAQDPQDLQTLVSLGQIYLWQRDVTQASAVLREAALLRPRNRLIYRMLLDVLQSAENVDEIEPILATLLEMNPDGLDNRIALADIFAQRGEHQRLLELIEAAPAEARADPRMRERLAVALHRLGENGRALTLVDELLAGPDEPGELLVRLRVSILSAQARYDDAIAAMAQWRPADATGRRDRELLLSRLYERVGQTDQAVASLERALAQAEGDEAAGLELRLIGTLERHGRREQAIERLRGRLASTADVDRRILLLATLAELYQRDGRVEEGLAVLDRGIAALAAEDKKSAERLRLSKLGLLLAAEAWPELLELASTLDAADGNALFVRVARAEAMAQTGRVDDALALLVPSSEDPPESHRQLLARRVALAFEHDRAGWAQELIATAAAGGTTEDLLFAAQLWQQGERYQRMIPLLVRATEQQPESIPALFMLAAAYERSGDVAHATATFERLLERAPDHAQSLNYLGYMWAERGENLDRALTLIQRAVALDPDNGAYVDSLGWAHYQLGNYEQARQLLEWAARLVDDDATVFEHLGDLYLALDQRERARESYRQALELADEPEPLKNKLDQLEQGL